MTRSRFNRPGLSWLSYRAGTYGTFLSAMKAALSSSHHPELAALTTREPSDAALALLDAWAVVGDVLTFYNERDANEGYVRTATEDRSVFEIARLVGYRPRPGVAASVFLAYALEKDARLTIKRGSRVQSVPGPGQLPQTYETTSDLVARAEWSALRPRLTVPQSTLGDGDVLYLKGSNLSLRPNDALLFTRATGKTELPTRFARIASVHASFDRNMTTVMLEPGVPKQRAQVPASNTVAPPAAPGPTPPQSPAPAREGSFSGAALDVARRLKNPPTSPPASEPETEETPQVLTAAASVAPEPGGEPTSNPKQESPGDDGMLGAVLVELNPQLSADDLQAAASRADVTLPPADAVYVFRVQSGPFGHAAPKRPTFERPAATPAGTADAAATRPSPVDFRLVGYDEWKLGALTKLPAPPAPEDRVGVEPSRSVTLDSVRDSVAAGGWVAIVRPHEREDSAAKTALSLWKANVVETISRADYGVSARATMIALEQVDLSEVSQITPDAHLAMKWKGWLDPEIEVVKEVTDPNKLPDLTVLRKTVVYAQSERLEPATRPADAVLGDARIELDGFFGGIEKGRTLIVEGERADLLADPQPQVDAETGTTAVKSSGVRFAEVVEVVDASHRAVHGAGDSLHTHLSIRPSLSARYKASTVTIHGNVVAATHGETRAEVLGSGDAAAAYQRFTVKQAPLTFVPATTPSGVATTLELRVNDIAWREVPALLEATGDERVFVADADEDGRVRVTFGDGVQGARVPTGVENVKATYRVGIGAAGNAPAGQISQLLDRPLGAKEVRNPLPSTGGADPDRAWQARILAPLTVHALDRLVSAADYRHFAALFAGIAKATATESWRGARVKVTVAVAGAGGMAIVGSELHGRLRAALRQFGDPSQMVEVVDVERHLLVVKARVKVRHDYLFDAVRPLIEAAMYEAFSFDRRPLGEALHLSQVVALMQSIAGVESVDVDVLETIADVDLSSEKRFSEMVARLGGNDLPPERVPRTRPASESATTSAGGAAWLVYLSPRIPRALVIEEMR